jgi:PBP1b-binding outer membrane lipoprotein LpoB
MKSYLACLGVLTLLAGCTTTPPSPAEQADAQACTAAADATYAKQNQTDLSRPSQPGLLYPASPVQVFHAQQLGAQHVRQSQITNCERNGNTAQPVVNGVAVPAPHIINTP